jgi:hypothetical protein
MRWLDSPPCVPLDVAEDTPKHLRLSGPSSSARLTNGAAAAMGGVFAGVGLKLLRLPLPAPFKLVPLLFTAVGGGMAALGATTALSSCSLEASKQGLTLRWKVPALAEKSMHLAAKDVEAFEITTHLHSTRDTFGDERAVHEHRLVVVTKDGRAIPLEPFFTKTQATQRQKQLEARLKR